MIGRYSRILTISLLLTIFFSANVFGQELKFSGRISGYSTESTKLFKKMKKSVDYTGGLKNAKIVFRSSTERITSYSKSSGFFEANLPPGNYSVTIQASNYITLKYSLNLKKIPGKTSEEGFHSFEALLIKNGSEVSDDRNFVGTFIYSTKSKKCYFKPGTKEESNQWLYINQNLAQKTCEFNSSLQHVVDVNEVELDSINLDTTTDLIKSNLFSEVSNELDELLNGFENDAEINIDYIESSEKRLTQLKELALEMAKDSTISKEELSLINLRISVLERDIIQSKKIIDYQSDALQKANSINNLYLIVIFLLLGLAGGVFYLYREKKVHNSVLSFKNSQIEKQNNRINKSLNFSKIVQSTTLKPVQDIELLSSGSFIYYEPKEQVGGDFYWYGEIEGRKIVFVGDCTGHGVPGAMLSMLSVGLLEQIIHVEKVTDPSKILLELDQRMRQQIKDSKYKGYFGIDASVISIGEKIEFAGAMNGIYHLVNGNLNYMKGDICSLGYDGMQVSIQTRELTSKDGMVFMFTDGLMDQINQDKQKYNRERFEQLLMDLGGCKGKESCAKLDTALKQWMGSVDQLDDICVVGVNLLS